MVRDQRLREPSRLKAKLHASERGLAIPVGQGAMLPSLQIRMLAVMDSIAIAGKCRALA
jgi:hypothetical protein